MFKTLTLYARVGITTSSTLRCQFQREIRFLHFSIFQYKYLYILTTDERNSKCWNRAINRVHHISPTYTPALPKSSGCALRISNFIGKLELHSIFYFVLLEYFQFSCNECKCARNWIADCDYMYVVIVFDGFPRTGEQVVQSWPVIANDIRHSWMRKYDCMAQSNSQQS